MTRDLSTQMDRHKEQETGNESRSNEYHRKVFIINAKHSTFIDDLIEMSEALWTYAKTTLRESRL